RVGAGAPDPQDRLEDRRRSQRLPGQGNHVPVGDLDDAGVVEGPLIEVGAGDDRAMPGEPDLEGDVVASGDRDGLGPGLEVDPLAVHLVLTRIDGVDPLHVEVLCVDRLGGYTPGMVAVVGRDHAWRTGARAPGCPVGALRAGERSDRAVEATA